MTVPEQSVDPLVDVERYRGLDRRTVVRRAVPRTTLVLGRRQQLGPRGARLAASIPADVVHRRSGGSAVQLEPVGTLWLDLWLPAGDPLWHEDVGQAGWWVGEWWAGALSALGVPDLEVHTGAFRRTPLADVACFAGLGAGEVHQAGRKVVGVSQWRSRQGALFQCVAYRRFDPTVLCRVLFADGGFARIARGMGLAGATATAALAALATDLDTVAPGATDLGTVAPAPGATDLDTVAPAPGADLSAVVGALHGHLPEPWTWEWTG